jgi:hypothetical protein
MKPPRRKKARGVDQPNSLRQRRNYPAFALSLFISVLFWLMLSLSEEHSDHLDFTLRLSEMPAGFCLAEEIDTSISLHVRATGYQLLAFRYGLRQHNVNLGLASLLEGRKAGRRESIELPLLPLLRDNIPQGRKPVSLLRANPDTLRIVIERYDSLQLPVKPRADLSFSGDFSLTGPLRAEPDSVWVKGPAGLIKTLSFIETKQFKIKDVRSDFRTKASLNLNSSLLIPSVLEVDVLGSVERFTEKVIAMEVPLPEGFSPKDYMTLPARVNVRVLVAMSGFEQTDAGDIILVALPGDDSASLVLQAKSRFSHLKILAVDPPEVELFRLRR